MPPALATAPPSREPGSAGSGDTPGGNPFFVTGGTLPPSAQSYIVRKADTDLYDALHDGQFCYVLNTRQIGKSSLMIRTVRRLKEDGAAVVVLDLTAVGQNLTAEQWYDGLLVMLGEQLHLEDECEDFWLESDNLGPMQRFFAALAQVVLPKIRPQQSLILFVDEIDSVRSLPFSADEFFGGIRECYNRRVQSPIYNRVTFCLLGVATPADLIKDTRISPFNIGRRVTLRDFSVQEAAPLAAGMGPNGKNLLARALYWTGGHPYLTQRLCREISRDNAQSIADVDKLCERLFLLKRALDADDNLSFVQNRMLRSEFPLADVLDFYGKLRDGKRIKDDETNRLCSLLRLAGIASIDEQTDLMRLRNRIYATVFDRSWVLKNMPDAELRRQRQAAFHARMQVLAISAVVFAVMGVSIVKSIESAHEARKSEFAARQAERDAQSAQILADEQKARALESDKNERRSESNALKQAKLAEKRGKEAVIQKNHAQEEALDAKRARDKAKVSEAKALKAEQIAVEAQRREAAEANKAREAAIEARASEKRAKQETREAVRQRRIAEAAKRDAEYQKKVAEDNAFNLEQGTKAFARRLQEAEDNGDVTAADELGLLYSQQKQYDKAITHYNFELAKAPSNYSVYYDRGFCNLNLPSPDYAQAIKDYSTYLSHVPEKDASQKYLERAGAYRAEGDEESKSGDLGDAFKDYAASLKDIGTYERYSKPTTYVNILLSNCRFGLRQYDLAIEAAAPLLSASDQPFTVAKGNQLVAQARQKQGQYDLAFTAYSRYLESNPNDDATRKEALKCLFKRNRWSDLIRETDRFRELSPDSAEPYIWIAYTHLYSGNVDAYRSVCQQVMTKFGTMDASTDNANVAAWTCALGQQGLPSYAQPLVIANRAAADADKNAKNLGYKDEPTMGALWANKNTVAVLLYRAGKYKDSIQLLQQCESMPRKFDPADRFADFIFLAMATARSGDHASAVDWLQKAKAQVSNPDVEQTLFMKEAVSLIGNNS